MINTKIDIEVLKATLEYRYWQLKNDYKKAEKAFISLAKKMPMAESYTKSAPESRAIGLWIWDCVRENGVSEYKAIELFKAKYESEINNETLGKQFKSDDKAFRRAHKKAIECITNARPV